jgi:hypothetical protein
MLEDGEIWDFRRQDTGDPAFGCLWLSVHGGGRFCPGRFRGCV